MVLEQPRYQLIEPLGGDVFVRALMEGFCNVPLQGVLRYADFSGWV